MNNTHKKQFKEMIGKMSYFNAGEGSSYSNEANPRNAFKSEANDILTSWLNDGVTLKELHSYHKDNRGLSSFYEFLSMDTINTLGLTDTYKDIVNG